jgi:ABC-2 type transport system permease protein
MNVFLRELKANYKGLIWWSIGIIITVVAGMAKFEGYGTAGASTSITTILTGFPKPVLAIFGMTGLNLTTLIGYFGVLYLYIILLVAIHAGMTSATIIAKEERDKTSEFLYPKPISRTKVLTAKLAAAATNILVIFGVTFASSIWIVGYYNKGYGLNSKVIALMWGVLLFQLLSFAFGALFAGLFKNPKLPAVAVTTVIVVSYLVSVSVDLSAKLDFLKYLTPFKYFSAEKILAVGHPDPFYVILSLTLSAVLIASTYYFYQRRDLNV